MSTAGKVVAAVAQNVSSQVGVDTSMDVLLKRAGTVGLLPVRYALGDNKSKTPQVDGNSNFKVSDEVDVPGRDAANLRLDAKTESHYTLRTLRGGYLYVFVETKDKAKNGWALFEVDAGYAVGPETDCWKQEAPADPKPVLKPLPIIVEEEPKAAGANVDRTPLHGAVVGYTNSGLLLLKDNTNVWLCHSDALWTGRTLRKAQKDEVFRNRFMRPFDPKAWENNWAETKHTALLGEKGEKATAPKQANVPPVAELTPGMDPKAFWFSKTPFRGGQNVKVERVRNPKYNPKKKAGLNSENTFEPEFLQQRTVLPMTLKELKTLANPETGTKTAEAKDVKGWAVLALEDPVGMTIDLGSMMQKRFDAWTKQPDHYFKNKSVEWVMNSSMAIEGIKEALANTAESAIYDKDGIREIAFSRPILKRPPGLPEGFKTLEEKEAEQALADDRMTQFNRIQAARKTSWDPYKGKYHEDLHTTWMGEFKKKLEDFDRLHILPLSKAFVAWADSRRFLSYFNGVFDPKDVRSGWSFTDTFQRCYAGTQDKIHIHNHLSGWLLAELNENNLLGRAAILNLEDTSKQVQEAAKKQVELKGLPWSELIGVFKSATSSYLEGKPDVVMRFLQRILGPFAEAAMKDMEAGPIRSTLVALCVGSGAPLVPLDYFGNKKEALAHFANYLNSRIPTDDPWKPFELPPKIKAEIREQLKKPEFKGKKVKGSTDYHYKMVAAEDALNHIPENLSPKAEVDYMVTQLMDEQTAHTRLENLCTRNSAAFGIVSTVFQFAALTVLLKDMQGAMAHDQGAAKARFVISLGGLIGSTMETLGNLIKGATETGLRYGSRRSVLAEGAIWLGERASVAAAFFLAGVDFWSAGKAFSDKKYALGATLAISGLLTIGATLYFLYASTLGWTGPWGIIIILATFAIGVAITKIKNNPIQDWLERCNWGILPADKRYETMRIELKQLNIATSGAF